MKKVIILLAIALGSVSAITAQDYVPLVREGVKWKCGIVHENYAKPEKSYISPYTILFKGDTIIGDYMYKNCLVIPDGYPETFSDSTLCGFAREDIAGKKVYYLANFDFRSSVYNPHDKGPYGWDFCYGEVLWYDFNNMKESYELKTQIDGGITVHIDSIEIVGRQRKRHNVSSYDNSFSVIEGVGSSGDFNHCGYSDKNHGDLLNRVTVYYNGMTTAYPIFYHLEDADGNIIYDAPNDPPGVDGIGEVTKISEDAVEVARYDVHGRRFAKPVPGINIIRMSDGSVRKIIVK